jgi:hypothetical protein
VTAEGVIDFKEEKTDNKPETAIGCGSINVNFLGCYRVKPSNTVTNC